MISPFGKEEPLNMNQLSPDFFVAGQISAKDVAQIAAKGVKAIICNRPDGEGLFQPASKDIRAAAEAAGLNFAYIPIVPGRATMDDVQAFATAVKETTGPVLAYCRTGNRSGQLWSHIMAHKGAA